MFTAQAELINLLIMELLQGESSGKLTTNHVSVYLTIACNFPYIYYFPKERPLMALPLAEATSQTMNDNCLFSHLGTPEVF